MASQSAVTPRPSAVNPRATGPGPLRTARGAGRRAVERPLLERDAGFFFVLRDRELADFFFALVPREEVVVLLRDAVGEDVRVAMLMTLLIRHTSHMHHGCVSPLGFSAGAQPVTGSRYAR